MSWWARYKLWFNVYETGGSWFVERDSRTVALLTDPQYVDMFWDAWRLEPLVEDSSERAIIMSNGYWNDEFLPRTVFRSREYVRLRPAFGLVTLFATGDLSCALSISRFADLGRGNHSYFGFARN